MMAAMNNELSLYDRFIFDIILLELIKNKIERKKRIFLFYYTVIVNYNVLLVFIWYDELSQSCEKFYYVISKSINVISYCKYFAYKNLCGSM